MALDPRVKKMLNEFHKSQPALNDPDQPKGKRGILLGDLLDALHSDVAAIAAKLDVDTGVTQTDYEDAITSDDGADELG